MTEIDLDGELLMMPEAQPEATQGQRLVFVYGTLRRGGSNDINRLHPAPQFLGAARIQGRLFDLGDYPGLLLAAGQGGASGAVLGELYAVSAQLESVLDRIEGIRGAADDEYFRRSIPVRLPAGAACTALVYEINPDRLLNCPQIGHGDWMVHLARRSQVTVRTGFSSRKN